MPQYTRDRGGAGGNINGGGGVGGVGGPNKKKFGKNLNKLVKPAAPPIPNDKSDRNTKNGLLLLSTKKPSSGLLASKTNATISSNNVGAFGSGGAGGANGSSSLNLQAQSSPSTHQVLLSAVVGASHSENQEKLDAWGVAGQIKEQQQTQYDLSQDLVAGDVEETKSYEDSGGYEEAENYDEETPQNEEGGGSWDDYGGRGRSASGSLVDTGDDQEAYMSRRAKERALIKSQEEEARVAEQKARAAQRLKDLDQKKNESKSEGQPVKRTLWEPDAAGKNGTSKSSKSNGVKETAKNSVAAAAAATAAATPSKSEIPEPEPLIHLSSYEDRDRGEGRTPATAPRMLFDPKSGSMIEVKARSGEGTAAAKPRKERRQKPKKESAPEVMTKNGRSKQKGRKESQPEKKKSNPNRKLPRTCGVLYKRDGKGNLRSTDECDGDLGYGAHSVPGGRVHNAEAYATWSEENQAYDVDQQGNLDFGGGSNQEVALETGFTPEEPQPVMEWVKADDKLELITGADDSPSLKPTAKEFAPSEAALAAAVAVAAAAKDGSDDGSSQVDGSGGHVETEDEEEEESEEPDDGLGFDPLKGIDFMSSPSHNAKTPEEIATEGLPSLTLEPPMFSEEDGADESAISSRLFSFGASDTWSNGKGGTSVLSGWGAGGGVGVGLFGSDVFGQGEKEAEPPQFLGGATSSWGPATVPGLDRLPTINAADHAAAGHGD